MPDTRSARSTPTPGEARAPSPTRLPRIVDQNIHALLERAAREAEERTREEQIADAITRFTGSMRFVYVHLALVGGWIAINLGWVPGIPRFDPSFVILAMVASVEAIFLSTFILITQNRMTAQANRRADLDLQVSLLAEHEVTRLLTLLRAVAARLGVEAAHDPELGELAQHASPEEMLDRLESQARAIQEGAHGTEPGEGVAGTAGAGPTRKRQ